MMVSKKESPFPVTSFSGSMLNFRGVIQMQSLLLDVTSVFGSSLQGWVWTVLSLQWVEGHSLGGFWWQRGAVSFWERVDIMWVVVSNICYFHPYLGKWSNLTTVIFFKWVDYDILFDENHVEGGCGWWGGGGLPRASRTKNAVWN